LAEDAEYAVTLARAGVRVRFVPDQEVRCDPPSQLSGLLTQRRRWRAALRVHGLFTRLVTSKPLVLGQLATTAVLVLVLQLTPQMLIWLAALLLLTAVTYGRVLLRVGCPSSATLVRSTLLVIRLAVVAVGGFWRRDRAWERTPRN
jgi:cellulose synthase/poly-beta-1,6-N-acetylglucosamine synthase-like glycosyltransferase